MKTGEKHFHWADMHADLIINNKRAQNGDEKSSFVCASGITPSGTIHIGNFREIMSVELVVRALKDRGKNVRFIYSWDDYDVFRKVPANMPMRAELEKELRKSIVDVFDPFKIYESYARYNETLIENELVKVGVFPEFIYQHKKYKNSDYAKEMKIALDNNDKIKEILNEYRETPLDKDWYPVSVFSNFNGRDNTKIESYDGEWGITYLCMDTMKRETIDLRTCSNAKLFWRVDWPMRWAYEKVDFEPAGKEHHSKGGSFTTAKEIVKIYGYSAPHSFKYDFISVKGGGGKMSSSKGDLISLKDFLDIYTPELTRYIFAKYKPDQEFAISFDLDVLKIYEDYDRCERIYYGLEEGLQDSKIEREKRIYELAQVKSPSSIAPVQIPFRHLCNLLQINELDIEKTIKHLQKEFNISDFDVKNLRCKSICAINWLKNYAPDEFLFKILECKIDFLEDEINILKELHSKLNNNLDEKGIQNVFYELKDIFNTDPKKLFELVYRALIGKEHGPKMGSFIKEIGIERVKSILSSYL